MHKYVGTVCSFVVIEVCQKAVWSGAEMTGSPYGKCKQPEEPYSRLVCLNIPCLRFEETIAKHERSYFSPCISKHTVNFGVLLFFLK